MAENKVFESIMNGLNESLSYAKGDTSKARKQKRMSALSEFAGSMKETWKDVDALEYQKKLREERTIG